MSAADSVTCDAEATEDDYLETLAERRLTLFQLHLLAGVAHDPAKGLAVRDRIEPIYGQVRHGRLYPNLETLADNGLIEIERKAIDQRTNRYTITDAGRERLEAEAAFIAAALENGNGAEVDES